MRRLRQDILRYTHQVYAKGWVANHDGNVTARSSADRITATPTAMSKGDIEDADLVVVDLDGKKVSGRRRSFSEMALHLAIYQARPDVKAIIHAHPPYATAMAVAGMGLEKPFIAEAVVSLGERIPLVPFAVPKTPEWSRSVAEYSLLADALLLQNHGVIAYGDDLEQAFLRLELVEHLATILHHSMAFGGPRYLDEAHLAPLRASRMKAGLGPQARGLAPPTPGSTSRPTQTPAPRPQPAKPQVSRTELVSIITEELRKL